MENPKTTVAGYVGLAGSILSAVGTIFIATPWGAALLGIGSLLSGANGVGNMLAKDAK